MAIQWTCAQPHHFYTNDLTPYAAVTGNGSLRKCLEQVRSWPETGLWCSSVSVFITPGITREVPSSPPFSREGFSSFLFSHPLCSSFFPHPPPPFLISLPLLLPHALISNSSSPLPPCTNWGRDIWVHIDKAATREPETFTRNQSLI